MNGFTIFGVFIITFLSSGLQENACSEFYFIGKPYPETTRDDLSGALEKFRKRKRKFWKIIQIEMETAFTVSPVGREYSIIGTVFSFFMSRLKSLAS